MPSINEIAKGRMENGEWRNAFFVGGVKLQSDQSGPIKSCLLPRVENSSDNA